MLCFIDNTEIIVTGDIIEEATKRLHNLIATQRIILNDSESTRSHSYPLLFEINEAEISNGMTIDSKLKSKEHVKI